MYTRMKYGDILQLFGTLMQVEFFPVIEWCGSSWDFMPLKWVALCGEDVGPQ